MAIIHLVMMTPTEITLDEVARAISRNAGLSRDEIMKRVNETISSFNGLLTDVGAALILAEKFGIKIRQDETNMEAETEECIEIKGLVNGMKNIVMKGRVTSIFDEKTFTKKDGREGRVLSMMVNDGTGQARVAFWDGKVEEAKKIKKGNTITVINASVKDGYKGTIDVNVNDKTAVKIDDEGGEPTEEEKNMTIDNAKGAKGIERCTIAGAAIKKLEPKEFTKKDGTTGTVNKVIVKDESGTGVVIFWTERVDDYNAIVVDAKYQFKNVTVKFSDFKNENEFHANRETMVTKVE